VLFPDILKVVQSVVNVQYQVWIPDALLSIACCHDVFKMSVGENSESYTIFPSHEERVNFKLYQMSENQRTF